MEATGKILEENGIRYPYSPDLRAVWEAPASLDAKVGASNLLRRAGGQLIDQTFAFAGNRCCLPTTHEYANGNQHGCGSS